MNWISIAIKYRHLLGYGLAIISVGLLVLYIRGGGYTKCKNEEITKAATSQAAAVEGRKEIEHETNSLERNAIIEQLRSRGELRPADNL